MAGGTATRLFPASRAGNKHLFPVFDKPMVYYPLSTLVLAGVRDILLIASPIDVPRFHDLLGDGQQWGLSIQYATQPVPNGIPGGLLIGREFLAGGRVALMLGDNIFFGAGLAKLLERVVRRRSGAVIVGSRVGNPREYGVVEVDPDGRIASLVEKPSNPRSDWAVTGLYVYDAGVVDIVESLKPSSRGEFEVSDVNNEYLRRGELHLERVGEDVSWTDAGTPEGLTSATTGVRDALNTSGTLPGCIEECAWQAGFIDSEQLRRLVQSMPATSYRHYLCQRTGVVA